MLSSSAPPLGLSERAGGERVRSKPGRRGVELSEGVGAFAPESTDGWMGEDDVRPTRVALVALSELEAFDCSCLVSVASCLVSVPPFD